MTRMPLFIAAGVLASAVTSSLSLLAQTPGPVVWAPKPARLPAYTAPQRPHIKLADLKARHAKDPAWRELLVDDGYLQAEYIADASGARVPKRFHPDTRTWWVVVEGQMRVEIEGQQPFVATKGSVVQVPKQTPYTMETTGDAPSLRFAVNVSGAKTLYPSESAQPPAMPGFTWVSVRLGNPNRGAYDSVNRLHQNLFEAAKAANYTGSPAIRDDRLQANLIYGYEKNLPALTPTDKGHYHPDSPEFWLVMAGQIRYALEGQPVFVADAGDVAYVPMGTFHLARFHGTGPSCRLAITRFTNNTQLIEP